MSAVVPAGRTPARVRRTVTALAVCIALGVTGCAALGSATSSAQLAAEAPIPASARHTGAGGANTAQVVKAAKAFLATLSDEQKDTALYDFDDPAKKTGWSNFPTPVVERNGLKLGDLTDEQEAAALKVMEASLSEQGYEELVEIRESDDYLAALPPRPRPTPTGTPTGGPGGGGGGGGGGANFGSEWYYISFFGQPSRNGQFMVQFGGHHAAYNITYAGGSVSLSPTLTAVEPEEFDLSDGTHLAPLADKRATAVGAVQALTADELAAAEIDGSFDDLYLGPGHDGPFPTEPEGVLVGDLTKKQQAKVTAMLRTWVDDLEEKAATRLLHKYVSEYDRTYIGWSGGTTIDNDQTYIRLDGPSAWVEFSNQPGASTDEIHQHTIFRDETADYGWE